MKLQIVIWLVGLISLVLGIWTMVQIPTLILSPWFLVGLYLLFTLIISLGIGVLLRKILKSRWYSVTFASLVVTTICLGFCVSQYKPIYEIVLPDNYSGAVMILLSDEKENDFKINKFGIGYVSQETYRSGFRPKVIQRGQDISKEITGYSSGSYATSSKGGLSFSYLFFQTPEYNESAVGLDSLLEINAIDVRRLGRE